MMSYETKIIMHTCNKEIQRSNSTTMICRWRGVLEDYVTHVNRCHTSSYFHTLGDQVEFEWNIVNPREDQVDKCLLSYRTRHFLYHIQYSSGDASLRHSFKLLEDEGTDPHTSYSIGVYDGVLDKFHKCQFASHRVYQAGYMVKDGLLSWRVFITPCYVD